MEWAFQNGKVNPKVLETVPVSPTGCERSRASDKTAWGCLSARLRGTKLGIWACADQAAISLGNFLTSIILARTLAPAEYGVWALLFGTALFFYTLHASLITYPLSVTGAAETKVGLSRTVTASLWLTVLLMAPFGLVVFCAAVVLNRPALGLFATAGLAGWLIQESLRRGLMAHLLHRRALVGDALSYLGQAALICSAWVYGSLSLELAFGVMAATSSVAALLQAAQLGLVRVLVRDAAEAAGHFWKLGHWVLWTNLISNLSYFAFPWALAFLWGREQTAGFQALVNLLGATHPVMFSIAGVIVPVAARVRAENGTSAALNPALRFGTLGLVILLPYFAALALWPGSVLNLFYGAGSLYARFTTEARVLLLGYVLFYIVVIATAFLNGIEENRRSFHAHASGAVLSLAAGLPLVAKFGIIGACWAVALGQATKVAALWLLPEQRTPSFILAKSRQVPEHQL